ncbi:ABC transporter ATP-binding protein [Micromonosporaceae bacterium B7E4]
MTEPLLETTSVTVRYGTATALDGVSVRVGAGELVALIGPNGAGKTTLVNTLAGILRPAAGTVAVRGRLGVVPEGRQVFGSLSVDDNLQLGAWRTRRDRDTDRIYELLPELRRVRRQAAGSLSGGQQQMVAVGRALMGRPEVLVVDELSLGLGPIVVANLAAYLRRLNAESGLSVLLIEQNARLALRLCSRGYVLEAGRVVADGPSTALRESPEVVRAYLGGPVSGVDPEAAR